MRTRKLFAECILLGVLGSVPGAGLAAVLTPAVDGGVRDGVPASKDGIPDIILENSVVQALDVPNFEERGIIEFSLAGLSLPISRAKLVLPVFASNGPVPFTIDVFAYSGDGQLTLSDWTGGAFFTSFSYRQKKVIRLDVTSAVRAALASEQQFVGFRFEFSEPSSIVLNGPFLAFHSLEFPPAATLRINEHHTGGSLSGVVTEQVICRNMTTGQTVVIEAEGDDSWDCVEAGLNVQPGDQIMQTTTGPAD